MDHALQSYTPTVRPLNYDSLSAREGCEADNGVTYFGVAGFETVCVFRHDPQSEIFNQPDTISFQDGGESYLVADTRPPNKVGWTAWVASAGVRWGVMSHVTLPDNTSGAPAEFYYATKPTKVTFAFSIEGLPYMAIEKATPGFIEIKWFPSSDITFAGKSPLLFNAENAQPTGVAGIVCYYLKSDVPFVLFARFSNDNFATEYRVSPDMPVSLVRLIRVRRVGNVVKLYAIDEEGRDVTMTTDSYSLEISDESVVSVDFTGGGIFEALEDTEDLTQEEATVSIEFEEGRIRDGTRETESIDTDQTTANIRFEYGEISIP